MKGILGGSELVVHVFVPVINILLANLNVHKHFVPYGVIVLVVFCSGQVSAIVFVCNLINLFGKPGKLAGPPWFSIHNFLKSPITAHVAVPVLQSQVHIQELSNRLSWSLKAARSIKSTTS